MTLRVWVANGWLREQQFSGSEVRALILASDNDRHDAGAAGLSPAWSFNIAYNAALQLCTAALAAAGYRAERDSKHFGRRSSSRLWRS